MKLTKFKKYIISLAALLIAVAATTACSSGDTIIDEPINEPIVKPEAPKTYTMTVQASKGDAATTRALSLDGSTLNATWDAGEIVEVYQSGSKIGELTAAASTSASTTLTGTFAAAPSTSADLTFYFHTNATPSYSGQDGTLETIASTYDFCAPSTVTAGNFAVDDVKKEISVPGGINFGANQQAIVKFTLMKKLDNSNLEIPASTALTVNDGTNDYTVTPASATNVLFVAIPATNTVNLSTTDGSYTYTYEKTGVTLTNGKYYAIVVKMARNVNLSSVNANFELQDGDIVTGTLDNNVKICIADKATVTLDDVTIDGRDISSFEWAGITCEGDANIILVGTNTVITTADGKPAIQAGYHDTETKTLTISGSGSLTATGGSDAAGIGSGYGGKCGNITISGGVVTANGGSYGAGIGSGSFANSCGNIEISGGTVTATGGFSAAGIGTGYQSSGCGAITITEGITKVTATKGNYSGEIPTNCIGRGEDGGTVGTITIDDKTDWTVGTDTDHLNFKISKTVYEGDTWTLTPKTTN